MSGSAPELHEVFRALADPTRLGIVEHLSRGPASVSELAAPFGAALPAVMKHLKVLEGGRVVRSEKDGRVRVYRLEPKALESVERWLSKRRAGWNRRFDRMEALLAIEESESRRPRRST